MVLFFPVLVSLFKKIQYCDSPSTVDVVVVVGKIHVFSILAATNQQCKKYFVLPYQGCDLDLMVTFSKVK